MTFDEVKAAHDAAYKRLTLAREHHHATIRDADPLRIAANKALREFAEQPNQTTFHSYFDAKGKVVMADGRIAAAWEAMKAASEAHDAASKVYGAAKRLRESHAAVLAAGMDPTVIVNG